MKFKLMISALLLAGVTSTAFAQTSTQPDASQSTGIAVCDKLLYEELSCANITFKDEKIRTTAQEKNKAMRTFFLNVYKTGDKEFIKAIEGSCMEGLTKFQSTGCDPQRYKK